MLALVACVAVNIWLFRLGILWGVVGLNITKHVVIAQLCHAVGVNRKPTEPLNSQTNSPGRPWPEPSTD